MQRKRPELMISLQPAVEQTWARLHLQARDEGYDERPGVLGGVRGHVLRAAVAVVRVQDDDAAIGVAMTPAVSALSPETLTLALESLDVACRDLDDAVLALPDLRGDDVMASAGLVGLLFRVVTARRLVKQLELDVKAEVRNRLRASTLS
jgi:uncharacterized protein (UPF0212 family)